MIFRHVQTGLCWSISGDERIAQYLADADYEPVLEAKKVEAKAEAEKAEEPVTDVEEEKPVTKTAKQPKGKK